MRALVFCREHCPNCPPVKEYMAERYSSIDVETVDCDTEKGMEMARERWVLSTPTVVMVNDEGEELWRAKDVKELKQHENTEET